MAHIYRILVTRPDGSQIYQPTIFTSRKSAEEMCAKWQKAMPTYKHEVIMKK